MDDSQLSSRWDCSFVMEFPEICQHNRLPPFALWNARRWGHVFNILRTCAGRDELNWPLKISTKVMSVK